MCCPVILLSCVLAGKGSGGGWWWNPVWQDDVTAAWREFSVIWPWSFPYVGTTGETIKGRPTSESLMEINFKIYFKRIKNMNFTEMTLLWVQVDLYFSSRPAKKVMQTAWVIKSSVQNLPSLVAKYALMLARSPRCYRNPKSLAGMYRFWSRLRLKFRLWLPSFEPGIDWDWHCTPIVFAHTYSVLKIRNWSPKVEVKYLNAKKYIPKCKNLYGLS